nr:hypothetical protein Iba_chr03dCG7130 [Ipomoea batatas]
MQLLEASQRPINILHVARSLFGIGKNHRSWSRRRRHTVDPDPVGPQLQARRPDQPKNGVLRHDVVRPPHAAARGGHAGRADDAAPHAPLHHRTRRVLDAHRRAPRVDAENAVEVGEVEDFLVGGGRRAGVAEHDADGLRHGDALLVLDVGDDDGACAVIGKKASGGFPDAASTAGDYHNFVLEPFHGRI